MAADNFSTLFDLFPIGAYRSAPDGRQLRANLPAFITIDRAGSLDRDTVFQAKRGLLQSLHRDP